MWQWQSWDDDATCGCTCCLAECVILQMQGDTLIAESTQTRLALYRLPDGSVDSNGGGHGHWTDSPSSFFFELPIIIIAISFQCPLPSHRQWHLIFANIPSSLPSHHHCHLMFTAIPSSVPSHSHCHPIFTAISSSLPSHLHCHLIITAIPSLLPSHPTPNSNGGCDIATQTLTPTLIESHILVCI